MLNLILALIIGSIIGWLASLIMKTDAQQGTLLNIVIGVVGSVLGSWLFGDVLGFGGATTTGAFSLVGLVWAVLGACVLIGLLKLVRVLR